MANFFPDAFAHFTENLHWDYSLFHKHKRLESLPARTVQKLTHYIIIDAQSYMFKILRSRNQRRNCICSNQVLEQRPYSDGISHIGNLGQGFKVGRPLVASTFLISQSQHICKVSWVRPCTALARGMNPFGLSTRTHRHFVFCTQSRSHTGHKASSLPVVLTATQPCTAQLQPLIRCCAGACGVYP